MQRLLKAGLLSVALPALLAATPAWSPAPWLTDLAQIRAAIDREYPNRDWLTGQREVSLDQWFDSAADSIRRGQSDVAAREALNSLVKRFNDGHVSLRWPSPPGPVVESASPASPPPLTAKAFCKARGYDERQVTKGTAASLPGYRPVNVDGPFGAGVVKVGPTVVGVLRIGVFSAQGYPALCEHAVTDERVAIDKPCDDACEERLHEQTYARMTRGLMRAVEQLRGAGAQVLLIDVTRNGGGTEWAEAAARIVSPISLRSAAVGRLRSEASARRWQELADKLRNESQRAVETDRALLLAFAGQAESIAKGLLPCAGTSCQKIARAGFSSGLVAQMPAGQWRDKAWRADVFGPAQFPYRDSVWKGPLIVLVDSETWSAAEQFTALLRDNDAAVVMGTRTGGAGCGHMDGNDPIVLLHSGAVLELPNCVRFRKDGSNEVNGIVPDISTGVRWNDGTVFAGQLTAARLPDAIAMSRAWAARQAR